MKKVFFTFLLALLIPLSSLAEEIIAKVNVYETEYQVTPLSRKGDRFRERLNYKMLAEGAKVEVLFVSKREIGFRTEYNDYGIGKLVDFEILQNPDAFWEHEWVFSAAAKDDFFNRKSYQNTRRKLNTESKAFEEELLQKNRILKNKTLDNYLKKLIRKIHPQEFLPTTGRPIRIRVLDTDYVQVFSLDNGNIYISKAYIGALRSENELIALLAQQIAHLYKNHNLENFKQVRTNNLASGLFAGAAFAGFGATKNKTNLNWLEVGTIAAGSYFISKGILNYIGANYQEKQELEADRIAVKMLVKLNRNRNAMGDALVRISRQDFTPEKSKFFKQHFPDLQYRLSQMNYDETRFKPYYANRYFMGKTAICRS